MRKFIIILSLFLGLGACTSEQTKEHLLADEPEKNTLDQQSKEGLIWHYEDDFNEAEKTKFRNWISGVKLACDKALGKYQFTMNVFFHESNSRTKAVSFGHTKRSKLNELHLYVNPDATLEDLKADWIAPHEMSHLAIPFIGKSNKWFSEGFATYLSRKIMIQMGELTDAEFDSLYFFKISNVKDHYTDSSKSFAEVARELFDNNQYSAVYWGGAGFFYQADQLLQKEHETNFCKVLQEYQICCRLKDKSFEKVLQSFDQIIEDDLFENLINDYETVPSSKVMEVF